MSNLRRARRVRCVDFRCAAICWLIARHIKKISANLSRAFLPRARRRHFPLCSRAQIRAPGNGRAHGTGCGRKSALIRRIFFRKYSAVFFAQIVRLKIFQSARFYAHSENLNAAHATHAVHAIHAIHVAHTARSATRRARREEIFFFSVRRKKLSHIRLYNCAPPPLSDPYPALKSLPLA